MTGDPPPPSRRDHRSPAAGHTATETRHDDLLAAADAWCRRTLHPKPPRLPHLPDDVDDIAVERACNGDHSITLNRAELTAAWRKLERRGLSSCQIGSILGVSPRTVVRWRGGYSRPVARRTVGILAERRGLAA